MNSVDKALKTMQKNRLDFKVKGTQGEIAILEILKSYQQSRGGVIYHSFSYPYASNRYGKNYPGNIYRDKVSGKFTTVDGNASTKDEIDLLYITRYRIFVIEVKARGGTWKLDDWARQNSRICEKYPIAQTEKHCRHLYHHIYEYIPEQNTNYIVPMTVFVDKAKVIDTRPKEMKDYILVSVANNFKAKLVSRDLPLKYELNIEAIKNKLLNISSGKPTIYI